MTRFIFEKKESCREKLVSVLAATNWDGAATPPCKPTVNAQAEDDPAYATAPGRSFLGIDLTPAYVKITKINMG